MLSAMARELVERSGVELHLTTGRELFEADFVYLLAGQPL
jgi:hypothetical protein